MDDAGWRARRAARKEREQQPQRGYDGQFIPHEEQPAPMQEDFIGGFHPNLSVGSPPPPPLPPKDRHTLRLPSFGALNASAERLARTPVGNGAAPWASSHPPSPTPASSAPDLTGMTAVERSRLLKTARMNPHLQFMCGPLLRYDTLTDDRAVWHGHVMIVTADSGSVYEPHPTLTYSWDPDAEVTHAQRKEGKRRPSIRGESYDLGYHPADPTSVFRGAANGHTHGPHHQTRQSAAEELWVYEGGSRTFTFWRFAMAVDLSDKEAKVTYSINNGQTIDFHVPGRNQNLRWAAHSCNGFSAGVNPDIFRGPGFQSGYDPVWMDLLHRHSELPFHALVGGGDQLYCDSITREPELQEWVTTINPASKREMPVTQEIALAIDRFYFNHYCKHFRTGAFARANCSIPMVNMLDDHDLIDGFGSYPEDLQMSPIFQAIGTRGYHYFLLFQCFISPDKDGTDDKRHPMKALVIGGPGPYIPFPSHSFLVDMGPDQWMLLLDCRAERTKMQVCSAIEYEHVFQRLKTIPSDVKHLVVQLGIPIAYPRLVFLETMLESNYNPLVALGKAGKATPFASFFNKFNQDAELLDDLNDHWTAKSHKKERNWFIEQMQNVARAQHLRISFLSGDVHCAAVGLLKTLVKGKGKVDMPPEQDFRYMINVVTSAIVNTPPPNGVLTMVSTLAAKTHKTMHHCDTDETMIPLFEKDEHGASGKSKYIMGKRNWTAAAVDTASGELVFDIRVEYERGNGNTTGYAVRAPRPGW